MEYNELLENVYKINIEYCDKEKEIALKYNDKQMLERVNRSRAAWEEKLAKCSKAR